MISIFYQERELANILKTFQTNRSSGFLYLDAEVNFQNKKKSRVLVLQNGQIVYGDIILPTNKKNAQTQGQKLNREWSESAIALTT
ncbi:hypothetical protein [Chlorogloea sp. CCALA 695]|uniref:hypothetical protein n=1 Tax=Chlorogloea sp. CCALA 695 TaxID=2107693 RepID=UPI000D075505|nr:hypothetical protein [Chlorogloea sp. CCALA 695]PSB34249.1 hypothetical protein C7B70_04640 [Chlorogloea sp. CCALA 695]